MIREMRKSERKITDDDTRAILEKGLYGILSTSDENNMPYGVPLSYACDATSIYFHSATEGHKVDNISENPYVSFCVVGDVSTIPEKFTTRYESAIAFGRVQLLEGDMKKRALMLLIEKYSPDFIDKGADYIDKAADKTNVYRILIQYLSGKARR